MDEQTYTKGCKSVLFDGYVEKNPNSPLVQEYEKCHKTHELAIRITKNGQVQDDSNSTELILLEGDFSQKKMLDGKMYFRRIGLDSSVCGSELNKLNSFFDERLAISIDQSVRCYLVVNTVGYLAVVLLYWASLQRLSVQI